MSSSRSPWMVETEGADQFELEDLDGSPHAFAHGSSMTYSHGGCVDSLTFDDHVGRTLLVLSFAHHGSGRSGH